MNHLIDWYSKGFWLAAFSLIFWHYVREKEGWSKLAQLGLVLGITIYAISFSFVQVTATSKLLLLTKDLLLLGFTSLLFQSIRKYKRLYWLAVILLYALSRLFISQWHKNEFATNKDVINVENEWELLVTLDSKNGIESLKTFVEKNDLILKPAFILDDESGTSLDDYYAIEIPEDQEKNIVDIKAQLSVLKHVEWIEDNELITVEPDIPSHEINRNFKPMVNDPYVNKQWAVEILGWNKVVELYQTGKLKPKKKSRIFILDTGVDGNHEDLKESYVSLDKSYDNDDKGHGSHVAGIAAAISNNAKGISSVFPGNEFASITSIKVLGRFGAGTQRDIINGMLKAVDNGATVINMSLGGRSLDSRQKAYDDAVSYANKKGCIVVVAAGNDNADARNYAPANAQGVITVAAIDSSLSKASFSNSVEFIKYKIAAPGADIYSTIPGNQYAPFNGTSMASPYVAGLVALIKSIKPELNTEGVYDLIYNSGLESTNTKITGKVINAGSVLDRLLQQN